MMERLRGVLEQIIRCYVSRNAETRTPKKLASEREVRVVASTTG